MKNLMCEKMETVSSRSVRILLNLEYTKECFVNFEAAGSELISDPTGGMENQQSREPAFARQRK